MRHKTGSFAALATVALLSVVPAVHGAPAPGRAQHPALWRVAGPKATAYLFGSVHLATRDVYPLDPAIREAFRAADTLVFEIPLDAESESRTTRLLLQAAHYAPPSTLSNRLDPALSRRVREAVRALGMPASSLDPMRPWFAALTIGLAHTQMLGYLPEFGIERHFQSLAANKRLDALETIEEQVAMFRDLPEQTQIDLLRQTLDDVGELDQMLRDLFAAWKRGDARALDALALAPMRNEHPALYQTLIARRNVRMAERIAAMLDRGGKTFVVVGVGHLVGPDSVVQLLNKRGYAVTRD